MPNRNYVQGRNKEYKVCERLRNEGFAIVQRSAGSHSPVDVFAVDKVNKKVLFVQVKPDDFSIKKQKEIEEKNKFLNGVYEVEFIVL